MSFVTSTKTRSSGKAEYWAIEGPHSRGRASREELLFFLSVDLWLIGLAWIAAIVLNLCAHGWSITMYQREHVLELLLCGATVHLASGYLHGPNVPLAIGPLTNNV